MAGTYGAMGAGACGDASAVIGPSYPTGRCAHIDCVQSSAAVAVCGGCAALGGLAAAGVIGGGPWCGESPVAEPSRATPEAQP
eukprot:gene45377-26050_t